MRLIYLCRFLFFAMALSALPWSIALAVEKAHVRKVVLIAGTKSHGPGHHEYEKGMRLVKYCLDHSPNLNGIKTEIHLDGWPKEEKTLDDADTIVMFCDGSDHDLNAHPLLRGDRLESIGKQMKRGCGFVAIHYTVFVPIQRGGEDLLDWIGGFFDYESGPEPRKWYSKIQAAKTLATPATPDHPICRGMTPFELMEEYYYNIRFRDKDPRWTPILTTALPNETKPEVVAWGVERTDGGRGFGFTGGHFHDNWQVENFRRMLLNAIVWTARMEVPASGVQSTAPTVDELSQVAVGTPIRTLILTGHQHPGHLWRETTPALRDVLTRLDPRFEITIQDDPEFLATGDLGNFDLIVFNYCNWQKPGLSDTAKAHFVDYLQQGGGLTIIHFANGAFHFSLPDAKASDWPEWRTKICRRVWDHTPETSGHDAFGPFTVDIVDTNHPITAGMKAFPTVDELYFRQQGSAPIEVLATARSQVTGNHEPMAFVYDYGKGRVFQTVLGHAADSIRGAGPAEIIARGSAWAARRDPVARANGSPVTSVTAAKSISLLPGKFSSGLDATKGGLEALPRPEYQTPPFTVECWAKLTSKVGFNILVAKNPKESADHWEIYSYAGTGEFSAYLPGYTPAETRSGVDICDGKWHHVAMAFDGTILRLFVDGKVANSSTMKRVADGGATGPLWIGTIPPALGCEGLIDDVRISNVVRTISKVPETSLQNDAQTVGLWSLDKVDSKQEIEDSSSLKNPAKPISAAPPAAATKAQDHFGEDEVGFRWTENDSRDDRWREMETGPFFSGTIGTPEHPTFKGICVRLGDHGEAALCYDTELLRVSAAWAGDFLRFNPARFGLIAPPVPAGDIQWTTPSTPGWARQGDFADPRLNKPYGPLPPAWAKYERLFLHGNRVTLGYKVAGVEILESPWIEKSDGGIVYTRTFAIAPAKEEMRMLVADANAHAAILGSEARLDAVANGPIILAIPPHERSLTLKLFVASKGMQRSEIDQLAKTSPPPADIRQWTRPGPPRWTAIIQTKGVVSTDKDPYVVDTLTLPFNNPYKALFFASGHDFFSNGDAAICTVHGDVWLVSGIDNELKKLTWKRFATGLFQPLGLKIIDDVVYVLGRDQISVLRDANGDAEADVYENLNNEGQVTANAHEFVTCLETDSQGNFYYLKGDSEGKTAHDGCLLRVSKDGSQLDIVATGIRNGNGLAIGPDDSITASPQEGTWTPASAICQIQPGGFYGAIQAHHRANMPTTFDPPLCWLPRLQDNSSGGQCWITSDRWGPLTGHLLHFSFGRSKMLLVLREAIGKIAQGGTVEFPLDFASGVMRGRFRPQDGQLYVSGLKGWVSNAVHDGCFQRVRYTGGLVSMPTSLRTMQNGIAITFAEPLDSASAQDPDNFNIQRWNYRWTNNYGSPEYSVREPDREGRDPVRIKSATLLDDQRTVFLEIDDMVSVMQMGIAYNLRSAAGTDIRQTIYNTIHQVGPERVDAARLAAPTRQRLLSDEAESRLRPGLILDSIGPQGVTTDATVVRLAAAFLPKVDLGEQLRFRGFLHVPLKGDYRFRAVSQGTLTLSINGQSVSFTGSDISAVDAGTVSLNKGHNRFELAYSPTPGSGQALRLYWKTTGIPEEPIPPTAFFHDSSDGDLAIFARRQRGKELAIMHQCARCHTLGDNGSDKLTPYFSAPRLDRLGDRLTADWIYRWILDPNKMRRDARMPRMFAHPADPMAQQQIADLTAYLTRGEAITPFDREESNPESLDAATAKVAIIAKGEILYEDLGCIACHTFEPAGEKSAYPRTSLYVLKAKYKTRALQAFLRDPFAHNPSSLMPRFPLTASEIEALAAFLCASSKGELPELQPLPNANPARGKELYTSLGCENCHSDDTTIDTVAGRDIDDIASDAGCLRTVPRLKGNAPDFAWTPQEQEALAEWLREEGSAKLSAVNEPRFLLKTLNCTACHPRDGAPGSLAEVWEAESSQGNLPEYLPDLTWAGEKLRGNWTEKLFRGNLSNPTRPWLKARMPQFPTFAADLSQGLAWEHGWTADDDVLAPSSELADLGRELTQKGKGFDCRECHGIGAEQPTGGKETLLAPGINFLVVSQRLRIDFYRRFMLDPFRYNPRAKMPKFAEDGIHTKVTGLLGGNAERQFDAIWQYLHNLPTTNAASALQSSSPQQASP